MKFYTRKTANGYKRYAMHGGSLIDLDKIGAFAKNATNKVYDYINNKSGQQIRNAANSVLDGVTNVTKAGTDDIFKAIEDRLSNLKLKGSGMKNMKRFH